jgi:AGCS family alanine or glycine:cation symporter
MMLNLIDGVFALMAIPTMVSTFILAPKVIKEIKSYTQKLKEAK